MEAIQTRTILFGLTRIYYDSIFLGDNVAIDDSKALVDKQLKQRGTP